MLFGRHVIVLSQVGHLALGHPRSVEDHPRTGNLQNLPKIMTGSYTARNFHAKI